jgi:hypothetical protein
MQVGSLSICEGVRLIETAITLDKKPALLVTSWLEI